MKSNNILVPGMCVMMLAAVLGCGCAAGKVKTEQPALIGLVVLDANDELNIVNWTVDGTFGDPKLDSFDWELNGGKSVWSGIAEKNDKTPDAAGVYYIDANKNDVIDAGDTFRVKAPEGGDFILRWKQRSSENSGEYSSHY